MQTLLNRVVTIFPPQGSDDTHTFFTRRQHPSAEIPGRLYLGIPTYGRHMWSIQTRVYHTLLAAAEVLYQQDQVNADAWMTLVGYFKSGSELEAIRRSVDRR